MIGWTRLTRTVSVWRRTTPCAKRRRVSARRKIRSRSKSTISYATEDDDIESQVRDSLRSIPWSERLRKMLSVKMRLAKTIRWNQVKSGADAEKQVSDDAKKAETTQLFENVVEQLSKSEIIGSTYETLKMRKSNRRKVRSAGQTTEAQQRERER